MLEPGQIIQWNKKDVLPRFAYINEQGLIDNGLSWYEWHKISFNEHLLVLDEMIYSKETVLATASSRTAALLAATAVARAPVLDDYDQFWNEWDKQKYIDGYVCLTANNQRIWISHIDIKYFQKMR